MLRASLLCSRHATIAPLAARRRLTTEAAKQLPSFLVPFFQYASDSYITQGIQLGIETIHAFNTPWVASFVISGVVIRLLTAPAHVFADKLFARRLHLSNFLTREFYKKVSDTYSIPVVQDPKTKTARFGHANEELNVKAQNLVDNSLANYLMEQGLRPSRIRSLKAFTVPIWMGSFFAMRNIITNDFGINMPGVLWMDSFLEPDPYFILPIVAGLVGFLNHYSQRLVFPAEYAKIPKSIYAYDAIAALMITAGVAIMANSPSCISVYYLTVSLTGLIQSSLLRHPRVKKLFGINRLPTDSNTPFRDLIFLRKQQQLV